METELVIVALVLSLIIGILIEIAFEPAIASTEAGAIASTAATSSWNAFASAEIGIIELIPFILSFFGALGSIAGAIRFVEGAF